MLVRGNVLFCVYISSLLLPVGAVHGQTCDKLNGLRSGTYNFHPAKLSTAERDAKSRAMDNFWSAVKNAGPQGIVCLEQMLENNRSDPYFAFDGSSLLISLKDDEESLKIVDSALAGTSLDDVDAAGYVRLLLHLSLKGIDIGALAHKYMIYPNVTAYVPEHAMQLDRFAGATLLYGSMPVAQADKYLTAELDDKEPASHEVALEILSLDMTDSSFRLVQSKSASVTLSAAAHQIMDPITRYLPYHLAPAPKLTREQVLRQLRRIPNFGPDFPGVADNTALEESASDTLTPADLPLLYDARRKSIQGLSDESLDEYFALSKIILNIINRFNLYADFRNR